MKITAVRSFLLIACLSLGMIKPVMAADPYLEASQAACNHLKNCARKNMGEVPEQYREMMEMTLDSMCQHLPSTSKIAGFGPSHRFYAPAIACMKSIRSLSCSHIDEAGASTPECEKLGNMQ